MMQDYLNQVAKQFLCAVPLSQFNIPDLNIQELTLETQETLINKTINLELVLNYPIKIDYQKAFIRFFVDKLEKQNCEVNDEFYNAYGRLVALCDSSSEYFKHYVVAGSGTIISLKENINLISEGTTGLRTWQASLALAEWAFKNKQSLSKKNILELGSGIGLTGLAISLECNPAHVYFSDCHTSVLKTLCDNIEANSAPKSDNPSSVNIESDTTVIFNKKLKSGVDVSVLNLPWEDVDATTCNRIGQLDFILAADVVYDSDLFEPLIQALTYISSNCAVQDIVFACTERNPDTLKEFLERVGKHFAVQEEDCPDQDNFIWCADPPIRIFKFSQH